MKIELIFLFILIVLCSGCSESNHDLDSEYKSSVREQAIQKCIDECENRLDLEIDLSTGPCLSDEDINWMVEDWVCDVAHSPREEVDNLPENQCQAYIDKKAHHFVEVDPNCELIRTL